MRVLLTHGARKPVENYLAALKDAGLDPIESTPVNQPRLETCRGLVLAVQWHPEDLAVDGEQEARALFAAFANALR